MAVNGRDDEVGDARLIGDVPVDRSERHLRSPLELFDAGQRLAKLRLGRGGALREFARTVLLGFAKARAPDLGAVREHLLRGHSDDRRAETGRHVASDGQQAGVRVADTHAHHHGGEGQAVLTFIRDHSGPLTRSLSAATPSAQQAQLAAGPFTAVAINENLIVADKPMTYPSQRSGSSAAGA